MIEDQRELVSLAPRPIASFFAWCPSTHPHPRRKRAPLKGARHIFNVCLLFPVYECYGDITALLVLQKGAARTKHGF